MLIIPTCGAASNVVIHVDYRNVLSGPTYGGFNTYVLPAPNFITTLEK